MADEVDAGGTADAGPARLGGSPDAFKKTPKVRKRRGLKFMIEPGARSEKGYPVTKDELWLLGSLGAGSTVFFSMASALFGYYVNVSLGLAFAQGISQERLEAYNTSGNWSFGVSIIFGIIGLVLGVLGVLKARSIINKTTFE